MTETIQNKIEIDLEPEVVGKIDALIESGLYENRLSFLNNAINQLLDIHQNTINEFETKKGFVLGLLHYSAKELEKIVSEGKKLQIRVIGGLSISHDVTPELADRAIERINMAGVFRAAPEIKTTLESKQYTLLGNRSKLFLKEPDNNMLDWNKKEDS